MATMVCDAMTYDRVAHRLGRAERTVDGHLVDSGRKTGRGSAAAAPVGLVRRGEL
jgi:hypothetical protein